MIFIFILAKFFSHFGDKRERGLQRPQRIFFGPKKKIVLIPPNSPYFKAKKSPLNPPYLDIVFILA